MGILYRKEATPFFLISIPKRRHHQGAGPRFEARNSAGKRSVRLVTEDPEAWHRENLARNPAHYSALLRHLGGARAIAWLQTETGARVFFNTLVPFEDGLIKYGVIATRDLVEDLVGELIILARVSDADPHLWTPWIRIRIHAL